MIFKKRAAIVPPREIQPEKPSGFPSMRELVDRIRHDSELFGSELKKSPHYAKDTAHYDGFLASCAALNTHLSQCLEHNLVLEIKQDNNDQRLTEQQISNMIALVRRDGQVDVPPATGTSRSERKAHQDKVLTENTKLEDERFNLQTPLWKMATDLGLLNNYFQLRSTYEENHPPQQVRQ